MFVCKCCGQWQITPHPKGLRVRHYGFLVRDVRSVDELEKVLAPFGVRLDDLKETVEK